MGLRSGLLNLGPPRRCVADLAAPIQLAPAAQQSKIKSAHQPPRSYRGQPLEAPQLAVVPLPGSLSPPWTSEGMSNGAARHADENASACQAPHKLRASNWPRVGCFQAFHTARRTIQGF